MGYGVKLGIGDAIWDRRARNRCFGGGAWGIRARVTWRGKVPRDKGGRNFRLASFTRFSVLPSDGVGPPKNIGWIEKTRYFPHLHLSCAFASPNRGTEVSALSKKKR